MNSKIKFVVISFVVISILIFLLSLLLPSSVIVSRVKEIKQPKDTVLKQIISLSQWSNWMQGAKQLQYVSTQQSKLNNTIITIQKLTDSSITTFWQQPSNSYTVTITVFKANANSSIVQWQFEQKTGLTPWAKIGSITNEKILGPVMEQSLDNLNNLLVQQ